MKVRIKKLVPEAKILCYAHPTDAGLDLMATSRTIDEYGNVVYGTGLAFEIPEGYVGLVFPRSSNSKKDLILSNCVGVIDSGYRGEVTFKFKGVFQKVHRNYVNEQIVCPCTYEVGSHVGQMIILPYPKIEFEEAEELTETDRGQRDGRLWQYGRMIIAPRAARGVSRVQVMQRRRCITSKEGRGATVLFTFAKTAARGT